jgi:hypothetical protein
LTRPSRARQLLSAAPGPHLECIPRPPTMHVVCQ